MIEQFKQKLESAKQSVLAEFARVEKLIADATKDLHYLKGQHDALDSQLATLAADAPPAVADTAAAVAADTKLAADVSAVAAATTPPAT